VAIRDEQRFLRRLVYRLQLIEELERHERAQDWTLALPGSQLAEDDQPIRPFRVSHLVGHALALSLDSMLGTRLLVQDPANPVGVRLLMAAPFAMLRTAVEAGALAQWVLAPGSSVERRFRTLQATWSDVISDDQLVLAMTEARQGDSRETVRMHQAQRRSNTRSVRGKKAALRDAAVAGGIDIAEMQRGRPGFGPLVAEAAASAGIDPNIATGLWRTLSGLTHPSASRSIAVSSIELTDTHDPDVARAVVTARPDLLAVATEAAFASHLAALHRTAELGGNTTIRFRPSESLLRSAPTP
jgi:hypothetical protein